MFYGINAMLPNGGGIIVNKPASGPGGLHRVESVRGTKHAVVDLTKQIAVEYAAAGIRAVAFIKTGLEAALDQKSRCLQPYRSR